MSVIQINVPDIGDFKDVEIIEILVNVGDTVAPEQSLITVESDKASMEIPCPTAGVIKALHVKLGDKVSEGSLIADLEAQEATQPETPQAQSATTASPTPPQTASAVATPAPVAAPSTPAPVVMDDFNDPNAYDLVVLGAGPGGYSAAFRAADLGLKVALIERYSTLGGVCLNVGCIPSKSLLHNVAVLEEAIHLAANGIQFAKPQVDIDVLRQYKEKVVGRLTGGLAAMAKMRKVTVIQGVATFTDAHHYTVEQDGQTQTVAFKQTIIAAGSRAVHLPFLPEDERIIDSTGALALPFIPKRMLIIGGGIIGLEMATVYSALGARIDVVEMGDGLMQGADRDAVKIWQKKNAHRFDHIMLQTKTVSAKATPEGIVVAFEGANAPAEPQCYDLVLQSAGRAPNGLLIGADKAGVQVSDKGFITVDQQMRTNVPHIYAIGDIIGQPMLAHKAVHEGHVAAEVATGHKAFFDARVIPGVAYTHPEVAWAGLTEDQAKKEQIKVAKAVFPWSASGRAIANGCDEGVTKIIYDPETQRVLGGCIVGAGAGDLISEIALAVEMGCDLADIAHTIHPHPTLGESVGMAAEAGLGSCTDLPPSKR